MRNFRWWYLVPLIILISLSAFTVWAYTPLGPMPAVQGALIPGEGIEVAQDGWVAFSPSETDVKTGLILYPGGRVDWRAYAPLARAIAAEGYLVVLVPMPFNLAVFAPERALEVIQAYPQIDHWAVGGHSLGGAMAAAFAYQHPDLVSGLILWASYPASNNDLSRSNVQVLSIYASEDGLADVSKINASRTLLPAQTVWVEIAGGNHAQFGWYGEQTGDGLAKISRQEQQSQIVKASVEFLSMLGRD